MPKRKRQRTNNNTRVTMSSGVQNNTNVFKRTQAILPPLKNFFPDMLFCEALTSYNMVTTGITTWFTFVGNGTFYNYGPQFNFTGAFNPNVPSGAKYLLASNNVGGASAPYGLVWTIDSDIGIEMVSRSSTMSYYATLVPSAASSLSGLSISAAGEQRGAVQLLVPPSTTSGPQVLETKVNWYDVLGFTRTQYLSSNNNAQTAGANPGAMAFWHLEIAAADGSTTLNNIVDVRVKVRSRFKFAGLNNLSSTQPS